MFARAKKKAESRWQIQIVETVRVDGKARQKIIRNVGTAYSEKEKTDYLGIAEGIMVELRNRRNPVLDFADPADFHKSKTRANEQVKIGSLQEEKRINEGYDLVMKPLFTEMDFSTGNEKTDDVITSLALARAFEPSSKLQAQNILAKHFDREIPLHDIYRSLDALSDQEEAVKKAIGKTTFDLFNQKVDIMFFDVTTLAFESQKPNDLMEFGFSKDHKFNEVQVVLAMVTTEQGMPITYKLFPGNQYEGHTLIPVIEDLKKEFKISNIFLAADRGMFNEANLKQLDKAGIKYVVACKLKSLSKAQKSSILDDNVRPSVVFNEFIWLKDLHLKDRRLIVSYSAKRAKKDKADRQRLVDRLMKKVVDGKIPYKKLIGNRGTAKYITSDGKESAAIDQEKILKDSLWDGLHGVVTNSDLSGEEIIKRYRGLWQIEEAFRVSKHDLKMRPIYHWTPKRIKGHICLCFITYALVRRIQFHLKQSGSKLSIPKFLGGLKDIQSTILVNKFSGARYSLPSHLTTEAKEILEAFSIKRAASISPIT